MKIGDDEFKALLSERGYEVFSDSVISDKKGLYDFGNIYGNNGTLSLDIEFNLMRLEKFGLDYAEKLVGLVELLDKSGVVYSGFSREELTACIQDIEKRRRSKVEKILSKISG